MTEHDDYILTLEYKTSKDPDWVFLEYYITAKYDDERGWVFGNGFLAKALNDGGILQTRKLSDSECNTIHTVIEFLAGWQPKVSKEIP